MTTLRRTTRPGLALSTTRAEPETTGRPTWPTTSPALLALALILALPAAGTAQVVVDDYSVAQGPLTVSVPPDGVGDSDGSVVTAGLGGERDLEVTLTGFAPPTSSGSATAEVTGSGLDLTLSADTTGVVVASWDGGDGDASALDPTGLGSVDLTDGGSQGGLRVTVESASAGAQLTLVLHTDGSHASSASRVLPTIAAATEVVIDFSELTQLLDATGPADPADVGAIEMIVRGTGASVVVSDLRTVPPQVGASQGDFDAAGTPIGGGSAQPGETIRYRVTISNTGGGAQNVDLTDVLDPNLVQSGAVRTTPLARSDAYSGFGNVALVVDGAGEADLVDNDVDLDGDAVSLVPASGQATAQGGSVDVADDGTFSYTPPPGFTGTDSFDYIVAATAGDPTTDASGAALGPVTATATVSLDRTVWFVDNTHGGPFEGTQTNPFATLADAQAASGPGDVIRLRQGDGTTTGYDTGITLKPGQQLIGGGVDLVLGGQVVEAADPGRPQLTNGSGGDGIALATDNTILGLDVVDTDLLGVIGYDVGHLEIGTASITGAGSEAILVDGGDLDVTLDGLSSDGSPGNGLRLTEVTGTLTVTGATSVTGYGTNGIQVDGSPGAAIDFGSTTVDGSPTLAGPRPEGVGGDGVFLSSSAGATVTFDTLSVVASLGAGLHADAAGTVNINSTAATVSSTGGPALAIADTAGTTNGISGWTFQSLTSSASPTAGVHLEGLLDDFLVGSTSTVTDADTVGLLVVDCAGRSIDFGTASVTDTALGSGATADGIDVTTSNAGATFTFDALTVLTDGGTGLLADNSGTLDVSGGSSSIVANGGPAVDITGTVLSVTLQTLSSTNSSGRGLSFSGASGSLSAAAGAITGVPNGNRGISINGGSLALTYGGTVTYAANDYAVRVQDTSGGSATFNGKVSASAGGLGILIRNADSNATFADLDLGTSGSPMTSQALTLELGNTGTYTFSDTQIFTSGATGFYADNGGTVQVTGGGNRVSTVNGIALRFQNGTTIGAGEATFERIDASGSTHGIRLNDAGSGFNVTGVGTTDGSGGTLSNISQRGVEVLSTDAIALANMTLTNASTTNGPGPCPDAISSGANTGCNAPIHLQEVETASLINVDIDGGAQNGLNGWRVTDLTLNGSTILNVGNEVGENGAKLFNLFGTSTIDGTTIDNSFRDNLRVQNDDNTELTLTIDNSFFTDSAGGLGIQFSGRGSSRMNLRLEDSEVTGNGSSGIQPQGSDDTTAGGGNFDFRIHRVVFENNAAAAIDMGAVGQSPLYFEIMDNGSAARPITNHGSHVISVNQGGSPTAPFTTATIDGIISGNVIGSGPNSSGTTAGSGIRLVENQSGTMRIRVEDNTVKGWTESGIFVLARDAPGGSGSSQVDVTIQGNAINDANGAFPLTGVTVQGGAANLPAEVHDICADIGFDTAASERNVVAVAGTPVAGIQVRQRFNTTLSLYQGGSASTDPATVLGDNNTITASPSTSATGTVAVVTTACAVPVTPP